nr:MAG TPA: hypothetical protein [Caudoviricetes sp.]
MLPVLEYGAGDNDICYSAIVLVLDFHSAYPGRLCCFEFVTFFDVALVHRVPFCTPFLHFSLARQDTTQTANTTLVGGQILRFCFPISPYLHIIAINTHPRVTLRKTRTLKSLGGHEESQIADRRISREAFFDTSVAYRHVQWANWRTMFL